MSRSWYPNMVQWPSILHEFSFNPQKFALVIVDMQNYLWDINCGLAKVIHEERGIAGYFFSRINEVVIPNHVKLLEFFRSKDLHRIFITSGPERADGLDLLKLRKAASEGAKFTTSVPTIPVKGTYAHGIIAAISPHNGEMVLNKITRSAYTSTGLDQILRNMDVDTLAFTGVATNVCVETTARDAADRGYKCILVEDACATFDEASHNATMQTFYRVFGKVLTTDELISDLTARLEN